MNNWNSFKHWNREEDIYSQAHIDRNRAIMTRLDKWSNEQIKRWRLIYDKACSQRKIIYKWNARKLKYEKKYNDGHFIKKLRSEIKKGFR